MMKKFFPLVIGVYSGIGSLGLLWLFQELGCNSNISVFFVLIFLKPAPSPLPSTPKALPPVTLCAPC